MNVYTLDIDSSERDPILYPDPSDYIIHLKNPIYNVTKISLISAKIHTSQLLINDRNNTFSINNSDVILDNNNYSGDELAEEIAAKSADIASAVYDSNTNIITFTGNSNLEFKFYSGTNGYNSVVKEYTTPHDIIGLPSRDIVSVNNEIKTGSINLQGPDALVLKLSSGSDEFNKIVFSDIPFYTGRILTCGDVIKYSGVDDTLEHYFHSGAQKTITHLRIQFFYSSNNRLIPYDFRYSNHVLKLSLECSIDKFEFSEKIDENLKPNEIPKPIKLPDYDEKIYKSDYIIPIVLVVITILIFIYKKRII